MSGTATPAPRGLDGVVAASTRLSHVDGLAGRLIIGGYELQELAGRVSFDEAASLLWRDHLPVPGNEFQEELEDMAAEAQDNPDPNALPQTLRSLHYDCALLSGS